MAGDAKHLEYLMELRDTVLAEMEEAEREYSRFRMLVERMESDVRIGWPEPGEYQRTKGHLLPEAEARVIDLFGELLKLEDKINAARPL